MAEPLCQMERAFLERLALVRSGGDSIRRSMAASSFYAAVEAVRAKKNGGLDFSKPPFIRLGIGKGLLYDSFFLLPSSGSKHLFQSFIKLFHDLSNVKPIQS